MIPYLILVQFKATISHETELLAHQLVLPFDMFVSVNHHHIPQIVEKIYKFLLF